MALDKLDEHVSAAFEAALARLAKAGAKITRAPFPVFDAIPALVRKGGFSASEAYAWHRELIDKKRDTYDQRVLARILGGADQTAADYIDLLNRRRAAIAAFTAALEGVDALAMPTCAIIPPRIADLENEDDYKRTNLLILRNTLTINILDGCSISMPMGRRDGPPCGLMLSAPGGHDQKLFAVASAVETALSMGL
jgi:aspartyl-tRNA(Asn)/glutamyl-tRNA(Gln) amidotransferase subunit A